MTDFNQITQQLSAMSEQFKTMAEQYAPKTPEVKFNRNGYEIRTEVLEMAKAFTEFEYSVKFNGYEQTAQRDPETGQIVTTVEMPEVPGVDKVLENAEKFYDFINRK
jgi:hypothetical protein